MNFRGMFAGVIAGLVVGGSGVVAYASSGADSVNLRCETTASCHQTIDVLYSDVRTLSQSVADLQAINEAQADRIVDLQAVNETQADRVQHLEKRVIKKRARW